VSVADWVGSSGRGAPTRPEVAALARVPVLCIYGAGEADSICPGLPAGALLAREQVGKGHHFSGEYATLADRILAFARASRPVT
jgi:type IV secretory pathway VirJ component